MSDALSVREERLELEGTFSQLLSRFFPLIDLQKKISTLEIFLCMAEALSKSIFVCSFLFGFYLLRNFSFI